MQLSFDFPFQEKFLPDDFVVSSCNKSAFDFVRNYSPRNDKTPRTFCISAPESGGKTYLANIWRRKFDAEILNLKDLENVNLVRTIKAQRFYIIEDVDSIKNRELLLHVFNLIQEKLAFLMMTSSASLSLIDFRIDDLNSRLKNVFEIEISKPDDDLIKMLLVKNFSEKQLKVESKVIDFIIQNLHRDFVSIFDMVKLLEFYSQEKKRNITIPLVKEVMRI